MERSGTWRLFTVRGVDVKVHVSLIFILMYITLAAAVQFPLVVESAGLNPEFVMGGPVMWGVLFAVCLFVSVFLHELGHVLVAQSLGVKVKGITLMMLGGVSEMEEMPEKRFHEFKVAIIGPLVSFGIGIMLLGAERAADNPNLILFTHWLGRVNIMLGIFNLLPAFPMDGGRVVRSLLASRMGMLSATRRAVGLGKVFAWIFGIIGFIQFNLLLMFIAFFLFAAGQSEFAMLMAKTQLKGLKVSDAFNWVSPLSEGQTLADAADVMARHKLTVVPVNISNGSATGLVSYNELHATKPEEWPLTAIGGVTRGPIVPVEATDPLDKVVAKLAGSPFGALPVAQNGVIVGVLRHIALHELMQFRELSGQSSRKSEAREASGSDRAA